MKRTFYLFLGERVGERIAAYPFLRLKEVMEVNHWVKILINCNRCENVPIKKYYIHFWCIYYQNKPRREVRLLSFCEAGLGPGRRPCPSFWSAAPQLHWPSAQSRTCHPTWGGSLLSLPHWCTRSPAGFGELEMLEPAWARRAPCQAQSGRQSWPAP